MTYNYLDNKSPNPDVWIKKVSARDFIEWFLSMSIFTCMCHRPGRSWLPRPTACTPRWRAAAPGRAPAAAHWALGSAGGWGAPSRPECSTERRGEWRRRGKRGKKKKKKTTDADWLVLEAQTVWTHSGKTFTVCRIPSGFYPFLKITALDGTFICKEHTHTHTRMHTHTT